MNPQKNIMITEQEQKQLTEDKIYSQKLENQIKTSKIESQSILTVRYTDIQQKIARNQRKKKTLESVMNVEEQDTQPEIVGQSKE